MLWPPPTRISSSLICVPSALPPLTGILHPERQAIAMTGHHVADPLFAPLVIAFVTLVVILFAVGVRYDVASGDAEDLTPATIGTLDSTVGAVEAQLQVDRFYYMFNHVSIMIFTGFGFLMTLYVGD